MWIAIKETAPDDGDYSSVEFEYALGPFNTKEEAEAQADKFRCFRGCCGRICEIFEPSKSEYANSGRLAVGILH